MANSRVGSHPSHGNQLVENATANFTLTGNDSGKTFILKDSAVTVTLPTLSTDIAGWQVTLISGDDNEHIITGGASKIYGVAFDMSAENHGNHMKELTGHSTITPGAGMLIGSKADITTDGTNWYMYIISGAEVAGS